MQRTERILIKPDHPNFGACHRLCGQARRLGNCAVYALRQRFFAKAPLLTRSELDKTVRSDNAEVYRSMPSAASAQRQTQIVSEQMRTRRSLKPIPTCPAIRNDTDPLSSVATATKSKIIASTSRAEKSMALRRSKSVAVKLRRSTRRFRKPLWATCVSCLWGIPLFWNSLSSVKTLRSKN